MLFWEQRDTGSIIADLPSIEGPKGARRRAVTWGFLQRFVRQRRQAYKADLSDAAAPLKPSVARRAAYCSCRR